MAGSVLKGFGGTLLAFGILLLLAAAGAAAFALVDQNGNEQQSGPLGVAEDRDRSDRNGQLLVAAGVAGAAGLLLLLVGIVLLVSGGARSRSSLERVIGQVQPAPAATPATSSAPAPASSGASAKPWVLGALVLFAIIILLAVGAARMGGSGGFLGGGNSSTDAQRDSLGNLHLEGSTSASLTVLGNTQGAGNGQSSKEFDAPVGTHRLEVAVSWQPAAQGAQHLQVYIERLQGSEWVKVGNQSGEPGFTFSAADPLLDGARLRFRAFQADDGASMGQPFALDLGFWHS
jgi:hypothetical protein